MENNAENNVQKNATAPETPKKVGPSMMAKAWGGTKKVLKSKWFQIPTAVIVGFGMGVGGAKMCTKDNTQTTTDEPTVGDTIGGAV